MVILDGTALSQQLKEALKPRIALLKTKMNREPHLVVVLVGEDPASQVYVRNKEKACAGVGIRSTVLRLPAGLGQQALEATIEKLNEDPQIDGILVQLPLPQGLTSRRVIEILSPEKDVDCFTFENIGRFHAGQARVLPCTPKGIISLLTAAGFDFVGKKAVVVGRSHIVGQPMAQLLTQADATVTLCHSKTLHLLQEIKSADLVVVAAGKPEFLNKDNFKPGAFVVDVGIHRQGGQLVGDVSAAGLENFLGGYTPVPGGVGPMTITSLLENTVRLCEFKTERKA
ncbi:MAG: bifunctional 5,10-methylenetetrahydrofolate dehydrogenase/5,10-methenyltetrahydrofolate cyclohydrolase [Proteobacteria bacterium]|jgi:methylenetetrahydrofolate dehydrogenase (NADP+)/methenyltetrahydrofolate cyclohydrolase|nr:bifunctional 5,10-methylenetetrahydrofolate dehydrogenase/5,10-methenyltetrahydrofolate cyclohydrolase [Pseudomonadota bacterium]